MSSPRRIGDTPQSGPVQSFDVRKGTERRLPIARGEGIYLWDVTGRRYLDASSGPVVSNLGHGPIMRDRAGVGPQPLTASTLEGEP
jgi:4-aminobutyrate aminotransferase-like enzyme